MLTKEGSTYAYDGMNRQLSGEGDEYSYDEISNILSDGSNTCEYQSIGEEKNQMRLKTYNDGSSDYDYTYDDNGNTESISGKFSDFEYDSFNRLRTVTHADDTVDKYAYNTAGLRVKKEEDVSGSDIVTYTMYSGNNPVIQEKYNGSAIVETRFNIISGGRILGHIRKVYGTSEDYEYFYLDDLSSRRAVLNSSGSVTDKFTYSAYGKVTHVSGSNAYLASFTGKEYDATGYIYFNARYYDPETGRFLSEDALKDGLNFYSYAANNPLRFVDPSGLWVNFAIGAGVGFVTSSFQEVVMNKDVGQSWGSAVKETFSSGKSRAVIVASTAIGALTSGSSALATQSAIGAIRRGAMLVTTQTSAQIIAKTAAINATGAAVGAVTTDVVTKEIKGQSQDVSETLSKAGGSALFSMGMSTLSQAAIATQSMKNAGGFHSYTTGDPLPPETVMPEWSTGFGSAFENVVPGIKTIVETVQQEYSSGQEVSSSPMQTTLETVKTDGKGNVSGL